MDSLYIIMPAYNEEATIRSVVKQWHPIAQKISGESRLVIIDDGSRDSTFSILTEMANDHPYLVPLTKKNSGHGATCLFGYRYAMENHSDFIFQTDSDGQTDPDEFWKFWENRNEYSMIVGTRNKRKDGFSRIVVTKVLKLFIMIMMCLYIEDANTPFRLIKTKILARYFHLIPEKFSLSNVLISVIFIRKKERCIWYPITFKERQGGVNSIDLKKIIKIGIDSIIKFYKAKKIISRSEKL